MTSAPVAGLPLPAALEAALARARRRGAIRPLETEGEILHDGGIAFRLRIAPGLAHKGRAARAARAGRNPFLPHDPDLFVTDLGATHLGILNKYPVIDRHLLIITRDFAPQEQLLDAADFEALAHCLGEVDGLGFYNGGPRAGASQPHKHMQFIPLPLGEGPDGVPVAALLGSLGDAPTGVQALPYAHAVMRLADVQPGALLAAYRSLRARLALGDRDGAQAPYNLLVTRRWMMLIPRRREHAQGISVNALGYAGSLFVRDGAALQALRETGPLGLLREVGLPPG